MTEVDLFTYLPHHKPIPYKLKEAIRVPYNLWDTIENYHVNINCTAFRLSPFANNI